MLGGLVDQMERSTGLNTAAILPAISEARSGFESLGRTHGECGCTAGARLWALQSIF